MEMQEGKQMRCKGKEKGSALHISACLVHNFKLNALSPRLKTKKEIRKKMHLVFVKTTSQFKCTVQKILLCKSKKPHVSRLLKIHSNVLFLLWIPEHDLS